MLCFELHIFFLKKVTHLSGTLQHTKDMDINTDHTASVQEAFECTVSNQYNC